MLSVIYLAASAVIALGYSKFYFELPLPNGSVGQLLDLMDYVSNSVMMPFIALLSGFNTSLKNGEGERILSTLDKTWPMMTSEQKAEMQKLLKQYGYSYEEG